MSTIITSANLKEHTMTFYERYMSGEAKEVYDDIAAMGQDAFLPENMFDIEKVLTETFTRVAYNIDCIYQELKLINYKFKNITKSNWEKPYHKPLPDTESLQKVLDEAVSPFGFVALSLKYFYSIVGGVNFGWDYESNENFMWVMADPLAVASLDSAVEDLTQEYWREDIQQYVDDEQFGCAFIDLAADDLHKDNVSGGQAYALEIKTEQTVDALFLNEPHETTFINYLRICFEYCGFPGIADPELKNDYQDFFDKVKPRLKKI